MRIVGVIPARFESSRFEGKPLADILGKPMVQRVWERSRGANCLDEVLVATDDQRIYDAVQAFGGRAVMTSSVHRSGTDRVAEAISGDPADVVVNIQGDEPMIDPAMIAEVVAPFRSGVGAGIVTLRKEVFEETQWADPGVVKVVVDSAGLALYFSRSLIPFPRSRTRGFHVYEHLGLYAYSRECLLRLTALPVSALEEVESLEQLRALENGIRIFVVETACTDESVSVDTPEDLERVRTILARRQTDAP
jgi:3-deoxy-manno-octulosonate cytidylyltransferase (CMP-KDO synthetase)